MGMRVAVIGGGPGGLYAAALLKRLDPAAASPSGNATPPTTPSASASSSPTRPSAASSTPTPPSTRRSRRSSSAGTTSTSSTAAGPSPPAATASRRSAGAGCWRSCTSAAGELGVELRFRTEAPPAAELAAAYDLVVAADGVHSATREAYADAFRPRVDHPPLPLHLARRRLRLRRLPLRDRRDRARRDAAPRLPLRRPPGGAGELGASTVIVEMREEVWRAAGLDRLRRAQSTAERCAKIFADALGGRPLRGNNSAWIAFRTVVNDRWSHGNTVLLGDAAHTAHFSIGSGTKLAVEDALALAACIEEQPDLDAGARRVRGGAPPGRRSPPSARPRASLRLVRGAGHLRRPAAAAVRLQPAHPQPPRHPRQSAAARRRLHRGRRTRVRLPAGHTRRCSPPSGCAD